MAIEGVDYQFVRSEDAIATATSCELIEVTTALACATGEPSLAVQLKTGIGRFFADLSKAPYKSIFNPNVSGAKAFNAVVVNRGIERWIEKKKASLPKKSGPAWGSLVHGNRVLSAAVFTKYGSAKLSQAISSFGTTFDANTLEAQCEVVHAKMVAGIESHYASKFLAVLFKNPTMSKHLFDLACT